MEKIFARLDRKFKAFFTERPVVDGIVTIDKDDTHGKIVMSSLLNMSMVTKIEFVKVDEDAAEPYSIAASEGYALKVTI